MKNFIVIINVYVKCPTGTIATIAGLGTAGAAATRSITSVMRACATSAASVGGIAAKGTKCRPIITPITRKFVTIVSDAIGGLTASTAAAWLIRVATCRSVGTHDGFAIHRSAVIEFCVISNADLDLIRPSGDYGLQDDL